MPLNKSGSKKAFKQNVRTEIRAGDKPKQAVAIAYSVAGESKKKKTVKEMHAYHKSKM